MAVTDVKNRDMNGFSKQKIPNLAHTGEQHTSRPPPATTSERLGFCLRRVAMPPFIRGNDLHGINAAGPRSDYCRAIKMYVRVRYHTKLYDACEQEGSYPSHIMGKYYGGY